MQLTFKLFFMVVLVAGSIYLKLELIEFDRKGYNEIVELTKIESVIDTSYKPLAHKVGEEVTYYDPATALSNAVADKLNNNTQVLTHNQTGELKLDYPFDKHQNKYTEDYLGAISIPEVDVSDSIYKSEGEYYLDRDYNKKKNELGELYLDDRTGDSPLVNGALINGHAVKNGKKFGNFKKLLELDEQPKLYLWDETTQNTYTYDILFVSLIDGDNSGIVMDFPSEEMRLVYYKRLYSSAIKQWEEPTEGTYMLLNSCSYIIKDGRYVVFAKKEE